MTSITDVSSKFSQNCSSNSFLFLFYFNYLDSRNDGASQETNRREKITNYAKPGTKKKRKIFLKGLLNLVFSNLNI